MTMTTTFFMIRLVIESVVVVSVKQHWNGDGHFFSLRHAAFRSRAVVEPGGNEEDDDYHEVATMCCKSSACEGW